MTVGGMKHSFHLFLFPSPKFLMQLCTNHSPKASLKMLLLPWRCEPLQSCAPGSLNGGKEKRYNKHYIIYKKYIEPYWASRFQNVFICVDAEFGHFPDCHVCWLEASEPVFGTIKHLLFFPTLVSSHRFGRTACHLWINSIFLLGLSTKSASLLFDQTSN